MFYRIPLQFLWRKCGWLLCAIIDWWPPNAAINFVLFIFCPLTRRPKRCDSVLPRRDRPASRLPQLYHIASADFRLIVASPHPTEAIETQGSVALSIFRHVCEHTPPLLESARWQRSSKRAGGIHEWRLQLHYPPPLMVRDLGGMTDRRIL